MTIMLPKPRAGEHTQGPWRAVQVNDGWWWLSVPGSRVQQGPFSEADAKRIVACVNACEGIATESLSTVALEREPLELMHLRTQNRELREALEDVLGTGDPFDLGKRFAHARALLAKLPPMI